MNQGLLWGGGKLEVFMLLEDILEVEFGQALGYDYFVVWKRNRIFGQRVDKYYNSIIARL